jgi:hypothetical protein
MNLVAECADETGEFFAPMSSDLIDELIGKYRKMRQQIENVAAIFSGEMGGALKYFLDGSKEQSVRYASVDKLFDVDNAIKALNSAYWSKALSLTDVYNAMPQKRRDEWNKSVTDMTTPEFTEEAVRPTISGLLASRQKFFAERVDGIFRILSGEHVTNSPSGFSKRMILAGVTDNFSFTNTSQCGSINDLRCVIAKFMGRDEPRWSSSSSLVAAARRDHGEWVILDGGAMRMRVYMKGTAHLEVHPNMAYRLNQVLAWMHPMAIPTEFRTKPTKKHKEFQMMGRPLPFAVLDILADIKREKYTNKFYMPYEHQKNKVASDEAIRVLVSIGGTVSSTGGALDFDYDPMPVITQIIASGCVPDQKTHQFYPTPDSIGEVAAEMAEIGASDLVLEPSAGQGDLAAHLPKARTVCVEISALHCDILKARGFNVVKADFIEWAKTANTFDCVVMNPPFSEGRWQHHLQCAYGLLKPSGRLVAVLPASALGKELITGANHEFSRVFEDQFKGTSISVVIVKITKIGMP